MNKISDDKIERAMRAVESRRAAASVGKRIETTGTTRGGFARAMQVKSDEIYFEPGRFLLGICQAAAAEARHQGNMTALVTCGPDHRAVLLDEPRGVVRTNMSVGQLRTLAIVPVDGAQTPPTVEYLVAQEAQERLGSEGVHTLSREVFYWNLALLTSRGRVPAGTQLEHRVHLTRWPNLSRLCAPPGTMRLIAYWLHTPSPLPELAEVLGLSVGDVFSVYSAASAAGLATAHGSARTAAPSAPNADIARGKRGLFSSIVNRLRHHAEPAEAPTS